MSGQGTKHELQSVLIVQLIIQVLAVAITIFRLAVRLSWRRLWWEDGILFLGVLLAISGCLAYNIFVRIGCTDVCPQDTQHFAGSRIEVALYRSSLWCARLSILISTLRLAPPGSTKLATSWFTVIFFLVLWAIALGFNLARCSLSNETTGFTEACPLGADVVNLTTDLSGDIILLTLPLYITYRSVPGSPRKLILIAFVMGSICATTTIVHAVTVASFASDLTAILSQLLIAIILIGCNLLFIFTFIHRRFYGSDLERMLRGGSCVSVQSSFTIVDLETLQSFSQHASDQSLPINSDSLDHADGQDDRAGYLVAKVV